MHFIHVGRIIATNFKSPGWIEDTILVLYTKFWTYQIRVLAGHNHWRKYFDTFIIIMCSTRQRYKQLWINVEITKGIIRTDV